MSDGRLPRIRLTLRVWTTLIRVTLARRRRTLPEVTRHLSDVPTRARGTPVPRLARAVHRTLGIGPVRPRCLTTALVLYRLLAEEGISSEVIVGLPPGSGTVRAHAWVEVNGRDVGPPPGRMHHETLARFPS